MLLPAGDTFGSLGHLAIAVAACFVAGLIRGFSGFGGGLVLTPLLSLLYGPAVAVPVSVLINLVVNVQLIPSANGFARWRMVAPITAAACISAPAGAMLLATIDGDTLRRAIGVMVLAFTLLIAFGWRVGRGGGAIADAGAGTVGGILNGAAAIGGAPITLYILGRGGASVVKRADLIMIFGMLHLATVVTFVYAGLMTTSVVWLSVLLLPFLILASWLGTLLFRRSSERAFDRVAQLFLIAVGLATVLA